MNGPVKVGQVWRDNDDRGVGFVRFVKVLKVWNSLVAIQTCNEKGGAPTGGRVLTTTTKKARFGIAGKRGFTLHRDAP